MSDDGFLGADEYDDFEDALYDADASPDLASDLAEHAAYSPVWQDDPVGELEPYYSDWEYYSDDYYDDDPILKQSTFDGLPATKVTHAKLPPSQRRRKRKLDEAREHVEIEGKDSLMQSLKGTVWAQDVREPTTVFHEGREEKVALLTNWRDLAKMGAGQIYRLDRPENAEDESWANDLSLADMGLLSELKQSRILDEEEMQDNGDIADDLEDDEHEDEDEDNVVTAEDGIGEQESHAVMDAQIKNSLQSTQTDLLHEHERRATTKRKQNFTEVLDSGQGDIATQSVRCQKRKLSPSGTTQSIAVGIIEDNTQLAPAAMSDSEQRIKRRKPASSLQSEPIPNDTDGLSKNVEPVHNRKRKLSPDDPDDENQIGSSARPRTKRAASKRLEKRN